MESMYKLESLPNQAEVIKDITKYENELKKKVGKDVVLIAYTKDITS